MNITVMNGACEDYEFDVAELADGTLAPEKARIVRLHLAGCARCRSHGFPRISNGSLPRVCGNGPRLRAPTRA